MEPQAPAPRKVKFAPKIPARRPPKREPKIEVTQEDAQVAAKRDEILRKIKVDSKPRDRFKDEKKNAPVQVAFGEGGTSNFTMLRPRASLFGYGDSHASGVKAVKEYKEPWDTHHTYYPVTLPLRRPLIGDPVLLDEEEFGEASENNIYNEDSVNSAEELGLTGDNEEEKMLFLQLPASLPLEKRSATAEAKELADNSKPSRSVIRPEKRCSLEDIPPGFMGKLLVYKSGIVKLKLGDTLYDVSPGSDCIFAQDAMAVNTEKKHGCILGELNKRAIVTPDVDSLLSAIADMY